MILERLKALREAMKKAGMDAYLVPTSDFHLSEYVSDFFKVRRYLSGFTGSAGTLVVTATEAGLWTDGRYFIQAERELKNSTIHLYKMSEEGVPTVEDYLVKTLEDGMTLGFDGRTVSAVMGKRLEEKLRDKHIRLAADRDLAEEVWPDRPPMTCEPIWRLDVRYCGRSTADKLSDVRKEMEKKKTQIHLMTSVDDIAWLFNFRGNDVMYNPVALSYAVITPETAELFIQEKAVPADVKASLEKEGVTLRPYHDVLQRVREIPAGQSLLLDLGRVNYALLRAIPEGVKQVESLNPAASAKAVKNPVEMENLIAAHVRDGVAFTKFMYWLKTNIGKMEITEISASDYLEECRKAQPDFVELSFDTIAGYRDHAAQMHYSATPEQQYTLEPEGLFLVDSGGQYMGGTTDITRTMILGPITPEQKLHFTTVVRSMLRLQTARFLHGTRGTNLDILSRGPLWDLDLDYKCGTGHGVGFLLNVHEGPNNFYWNIGSRGAGPALEEGMVTTDEPGVYVEGSHGIRIENELLCRKGVKNEYGQFMYFQPVTMAPIDLDGVDPNLMMDNEIAALNAYHQSVYDAVAPHLTEAEAEWLKKYTAPIARTAK